MIELIAKLVDASPLAAVCAASIFVMYKMFMRWMDYTEHTQKETIESLGEVKEALRRLNGHDKE